MKDTSIRLLVRGAYAVQKLRIQSGNRIVANFKTKLGQAPSKPEGELDLVGQAILKDLRVHHKKLTDGLKRFPNLKNFKGTEIISTYTELVLIEQYIKLEASEKEHFKRMAAVLMEYPIYSEYLLHVKGVGPAMAGVIISEIDIHNAEYSSSLWKYAGLDTIDGAGRSRKKEHLIKVKYIDKEGKEKERDSITFNPFLKTKLTGVLGPSFIKILDNPYRKVYDDYKHRLENHPRHAEKSKGHRHNMAIRYMIKRFLVDLYAVWRPLENLNAADEYSVAKLGKIHKAA